MGVNSLDNRLYPLALAVESRSEDRGHQILDHSGSKYKRCESTYSATGSGTQCLIERPSRTRRRISVAEMSMAGTRTLPEIAGRVGTTDPGRANTTTRASRGISADSCHAGRSRRGIGAEQQDQLRIGLAGPQCPQRVHRVRRAGAVELDGLDAHCR